MDECLCALSVDEPPSRGKIPSLMHLVALLSGECEEQEPANRGPNVDNWDEVRTKSFHFIGNPQNVFFLFLFFWRGGGVGLHVKYEVANSRRSSNKRECRAALMD